MAMFKEKIYEECLQAYEQGDYETVRENWSKLLPEMRLEIYYQAFRSGKIKFIDFKQFDIHSGDLKIIQEAKMKYAKEFALTEEQLRDIFWSFKLPKELISTEQNEVITRNLAVYTRLREYSEMFKIFTFLKNLPKKDYNILKCNSRRTLSRAKLLIDMEGIQITEDRFFIDELMLSKYDFLCLYQKEIVERLFEWRQRDPKAYQMIWDFSHFRASEDSYFTFLENGLMAASGDEIFAKYVEKKKKEASKDDQFTEAFTEEKYFKADKEQTFEVPEEEVFATKDIEMVDLYDEPVIPIDTAYGYRSNNGPTQINPNSRLGKREPLNKRKIEEFIQNAMQAGFKFLGYITTESGVKALNEDFVFLYLFEKNGKRFLEPIGQVDNRTRQILDEERTIDELRELFKVKTFPELVKMGIIRNFNHDRTDDTKAYDYSAALQKLINYAELTTERTKKKKVILDKTENVVPVSPVSVSPVSISKVQEELTETVPKEEIPSMAQYILDLAREAGVPISEEHAQLAAEEMKKREADMSGDAKIEDSEISKSDKSRVREELNRQRRRRFLDGLPKSGTGR